MKIRSLICILLVAAAVFGLAGCRGDAGKEPETDDQTAAPVRGADSVKTLVEKTLSFLHNGCDYSLIADVHDQQACTAVAMIAALYYTSYDSEGFTEFTWEQALEKAGLILGDEKTLREKDPELVDRMLKRFRVMDLGEYYKAMAEEIRSSMKEGYLKPGDEGYEKWYQFLVDSDKGTEYLTEHYPEILEEARKNSQCFSLNDVQDEFRKYASGWTFNSDLRHFKDLTAEYSPENAREGRNGGIYRYDLGRIGVGEDVYGIYMNYVVKDGRYYIVDYSVWVG